VHRDLGLKDYKWNEERSIRGNLFELKHHLKRAWDRVWNGVDSHAYWSFDEFGFTYLHEVLVWLRDNRQGSPDHFCYLGKQDNKGEILYCGFSHQCEQCKGCEIDFHEEWTKELHKVIRWIEQWFEADDLENWKDTIEIQNKLQEMIFEWLNKNWRTLWD